MASSNPPSDSKFWNEVSRSMEHSATRRSYRDLLDDESVEDDTFDVTGKVYTTRENLDSSAELRVDSEVSRMQKQMDAAHDDVFVDDSTNSNISQLRRRLSALRDRRIAQKSNMTPSPARKKPMVSFDLSPSPPDFAKPQDLDTHSASSIADGNFSTNQNTPYTSVSSSHSSSSKNSSQDLFKRLVKAAKTYDLQKLDYAVDPKSRRKSFITWLETLQDVTFSENDAMLILADFPSLPSSIDPHVSKIVAQLLRAYITKRVKNFLTNIDKGDAIATLAMLQRLFAPATHMDREKALNDLNSLSLFPHENVSSFMTRFHSLVDHVNTLTVPGTQPLTEFQLVLMFIQKLEKGIRNNDQRTLLLFYKRACQSCHDPDDLPFSLTDIQLELTELESQMTCKLCGSTDH